MANLQYENILARDCKDPPYDGENLTNRVLIKHEPTLSAKKSIVYYCPVYLRLKLKNFSDMNLGDLSATINQVIIMTVNMKNIPSIIQEEIKKRIVLRFNRDEPISLGTKTEEISEKIDEDGVVTFTIRKLLHAGMKAQIFLSPFEMINLILTIKLQKVHINKEDLILIESDMKDKVRKEMEKDEDRDQELINSIHEQIQFVSKLKHIGAYFNLMDCTRNPFVKISYSQEGTFGNYDLAEQKLEVEYSNEELSMLIRKENENPESLKIHDFSQVREYQFSHFIIPLYKFPFVTLFTIFIPLWLLGIINLGIFFQSVGLADRIGSLAALMIAFVALIPVIRQALPPNPNITLVQFLVYLQTLTTLLCFIESIIVRNDETYQFDPLNNALFIVSVIINVGQALLITILMLIHLCYWERSYNRHVDDIGDLRFDFREWKNKDCDQHFRRKIDDKSIGVLRVLKEIMDQEKKKKLADGQKKKDEEKKDKQPKGEQHKDKPEKPEKQDKGKKDSKK